MNEVINYNKELMKFSYFFYRPESATRHFDNDKRRILFMCLVVFYATHPDKQVNVFSEYDQGASGLGAILHPGFQEALRKYCKARYPDEVYQMILTKIPKVEPFLL